MTIERTLDAPMGRVWTVLRDYAQARPRILAEDFGDCVIHQGGHGADTVIGFEMRIWRRRDSYLLAAEEPTPAASCASATAPQRWSRPGL
jgi:hypothetical protein